MLSLLQNSKNKLLLTLTLSVVLVAGLTSCEFNLGINQSTVSLSGDFSEDHYYQAESLKYTLQDINTQFGWVTSETVGNQKLMIIPVAMKNEKAWNEEMLTNLENAFFGETESTKFESVQSYFYKSSYGNLNLGGELLTPFTSQYTKADISVLGQNAPMVIIDEFYNSIDANTLKQYDLNGDGFVDNAIFIYSNMYGDSANSPFWAWCYSHSVTPNKKPTINNYMWASYYFLEDKYIDGYRSTYVDAHTYIHETGHLLGLDDYYTYDGDGWDPAGKLDMQSYNVGDHNMYSKLAMGWVKPFVVKDSTEIVLRTSAKYPEAILINNKWNGSAFDEYILIEYYTPTGLNETDSLHNFDTRDKMYNYSGLRIYHVDARLVQLRAEYGKAVFNAYVDDLPTRFDGYYYYVGASNSASFSYLPRDTSSIYRYVHLLDQMYLNKINNGKGGTVVPSEALWTGSKTFEPSEKFFINGYNKFNDGSDIGYKINVSDLTDEYCTVTIAAI